MTSYSYDATEPATNSDPTDSQPIMLTNAASISGIISTDHVGFNAANGGYHKQISFNANNVPGGTPATAESFVYTDAGTANSAANLFLKNSTGTFPLSLLKAAGVFTTSVTPSLTMSYNCASIAYAAIGIYTITLTTNSTTTDNAIILVSSSGTTRPVYTFTADSLVITINAAADKVSFAVLQV